MMAAGGQVMDMLLFSTLSQHIVDPTVQTIIYGPKLLVFLALRNFLKEWELV